MQRVASVASGRMAKVPHSFRKQRRQAHRLHMAQRNNLITAAGVDSVEEREIAGVISLPRSITSKALGHCCPLNVDSLQVGMSPEIRRETQPYGVDGKDIKLSGGTRDS